MSDFNHREWFKKQYLAEDSLNDKAKRYFLQKVRRGEIDTLPEDPKAAYIAQMMDRERSLREDTDILESQFDDLNQVVRNIHHVGEYDSLEEAAAKAMERIGQEFGISFEFGRDY